MHRQIAHYVNRRAAAAAISVIRGSDVTLSLSTFQLERNLACDCMFFCRHTRATLTDVFSHGLAATSASQLVVASTAAKLQRAAPELASSSRLSMSLPVASRIALADMILWAGRGRDANNERRKLQYIHRKNRLTRSGGRCVQICTGRATPATVNSIIAHASFTFARVCAQTMANVSQNWSLITTQHKLAKCVRTRRPSDQTERTVKVARRNRTSVYWLRSNLIA